MIFSGQIGIHGLIVIELETLLQEAVEPVNLAILNVSFECLLETDSPVVCISIGPDICGPTNIRAESD